MIQWHQFDLVTVPRNKPILVTDGKTLALCEIEDWIHKVTAKVSHISMSPVGFGGYEWEYDFDIQHIKQLALVELPLESKP